MKTQLSVNVGSGKMIPYSRGSSFLRLTPRLFIFTLFLLLSFKQAFSQFRVIGYFPTWGGNISDIQFKKLTHINYAFLIPTSTGGYQGIDGARLNNLVSAAHANGVKVIISVGGGGGGDAFRTIVANASYRTNFANNMLNFVRQYNLDGVDIDWEYPGDGTEANNFLLMMQELYTTMHNNGKLCTMAVIAYGGTSIVNGVFNAVDFMNIMAYDENNFQHSTYDLGVKSVNYWVGRGCPANKVVLGVPFYGRDNRYSYFTVGYNDILAQGGSPNSDVFQTVGYNGIPTMKQKTAYALNACGGIMIWSIDTDDKGANSLLSAINEVVVANSNPVPDNLAKGKQATASSTETSTTASYPATNVSDGFYGTRWSSLFADPQWVYVDLEGNFNVNRVKISWETALAKDYEVQISSDAQNWTSLKSVTGNTSKTNDITALNGTGRYVRIYGTARATTYGYSIYEIEVYGNAIEAPYAGTPAAIPGIVEVENYDLGGEGLAYHDLSAGNSGTSYRSDDVDIQACTDAGAGFNLRWTSDGEWLKYMVDVKTTGKYDLEFRSASTSAGAVRVEVDGADVTGTITLPNTTAWQTWQTTTKAGVSLTAGPHTLRLYVVTGGFNLNNINFKSVGNTVESPYTGTPVSIPGIVQVENYDLGGEGLAYHDLSSGNSGTAYRTEDVDIQSTTDIGGGYNLGWTQDGEWVQYMVNVTASGTYDVEFRSASTSGGAIRMEVDGADVTGSVTLPNTAGWQTWASTIKSGVSLTTGPHMIRLYIVTGGFNLNYINIKTPDLSGPGYLHASGKNIVNKNGNFVIKAINLGNFMVQEGYMLNLGGGYQHNIKQKIADVVGTASRDQFYIDYHKNYVTKTDIDSIAKWGFNAIRLPMHYNLFTPLGQPDVYLTEGFELVDNILSWCKQNNIYLILDLHAAPGGQSSGDISDYVAGQPSLWESQANRDQTVKLWAKLASRYANEQYIGGYDLINETNWTLSNNTLLMQLMQDITGAIRQVDNNHILFIEGNSYANDYTGMTPKWDGNMAYSFHKYWNDNSDGSLNFILSIRDGQNVPVWLGEFGENSNNWIADAVTLVNKYNIGWAIWPYKKMSSVSSVSSFKQPSNWSKLADYINGGTKPSQTEGQAILNELLENIKISNCTFNRGYLNALFRQPGNTNTTPFASVTLPGKLIAANYDEGKDGYAYNDFEFQNTQYGSSTGSSTSWNKGWYYRNDGVDIQYSSAEQGPAVGWTENNDWMQYTVNVAATGSYTVKVRVAGNGGAMSLAVDGATLINNASIQSTGAWDTWQTVSLGNINLTAGTHKLRATITTSGYNISYFDFSTQTIVNKAPTINLTSPTANASFNAPATIAIAADASDADGSVTKVEFYNGSTLLGSSASAPYTFTWANVAAGDYTISAKATDNSNASASSSAISVHVNAVPVCLPAYASSDDGNVAANVLDNDLNTRWSANGDGQWIQFCQENTVDMKGVQIAFYNGNTRQSTFDILVSNDGSNWSSVLTSAKSSGTTLNLETFSFATVSAKYLRIVGHGNSTNTWNSFTEVKIDTGNNNTVNQSPSVNLTSPSNNASFDAPATITITADASDSDGSVVSVAFYNGTTLLGTVTSSPYTYNWSGVPAASYIITAKATDNSGATTSSSVAITVNTVVTNTCSGVPQYVENGGYSDGSKVQNQGNVYTCKPYPYSGWCNGAAWAYAPGTGSYWTDAWTLDGSCTASANVASAEPVQLYPNPSDGVITIEVTDGSTYFDVQIIDMYGKVMKQLSQIQSGEQIDISGLNAGMYTVKVTTPLQTYSYSIQKN